ARRLVQDRQRLFAALQRSRRRAADHHRPVRPRRDRRRPQACRARARRHHRRGTAEDRTPGRRLTTRAKIRVSPCSGPVKLGSMRDTGFATAITPRLFRTALLMCGDWHLAEDLVQTTLAKVFVKWNRVACADVPEAYARG